MNFSIKAIVFIVSATHLVLACQCNAIGSHDNNCNPKTGQCACKSYFTGKTCNQCTKPGLKYPRCYGNDKCKCSKAGTRFARKTNGPCIKRVCLCNIKH